VSLNNQVNKSVVAMLFLRGESFATLAQEMVREETDVIKGKEFASFAGH
jgi:hypothetical protein